MATVLTIRAAAPTVSSGTVVCTSPCGARWRTISATVPGIGAKLPGHDDSRCGHESQVPRCGNHSAGILYPRAAGLPGLKARCLLIAIALGQLLVRVDATVAQERPVSAHHIHRLEIAIGDEDLLIPAGLGEHASVRVSHERSAPELDAGCVRFAARQHLVAHAIDRAHVHAVGNRVTALDGFPRCLLALAVLLLLGRQPADRSRIEQDLGSGECGEACSLRVPLIPAHQHPDPAELRVPTAEAEIARREVELLVELGIVRDVHLAILAQVRALCVDDRRGVVIETGGALLEQRRDDHHAQLGGDLLQSLSARTRDGLSEREELVVLSLAEVVPAEEFLEADHLGAPGCGLADTLDRPLQVLGGVGTGPLLDQSDADGAGVILHAPESSGRNPVPPY